MEMTMGSRHIEAVIPSINVNVWYNLSKSGISVHL